jgi:hypothetical protein
MKLALRARTAAAADLGARELERTTLEGRHRAAGRTAACVVAGRRARDGSVIRRT